MMVQDGIHPQQLYQVLIPLPPPLPAVDNFHLLLLQAPILPLAKTRLLEVP